MKVTVVPAQVTTVEDRVMGNLSMTQVMLLIGPVFGGAFLYGALPPFMEGSMYKYLLLGVVAVLSAILSIRIKGRVMASILIILLRYHLRPRLYLYSKNTTDRKGLEYLTASTGSEVDTLPFDIGPDEESDFKSRSNLRAQAGGSLAGIDASSRVAVDELISARGATQEGSPEVSFMTDKKGKLYVRIAEVES